MKYGSQHVTKAIHAKGKGAPIVIEIPIDLCREEGFDLVDLLLRFLAALVRHNHLTPAIVNEEFERYNDKDGGLKEKVSSS